jgi:endonuclease/exonuclease/phosphatase family metal-dependent hydrolase
MMCQPAWQVKWKPSAAHSAVANCAASGKVGVMPTLRLCLGAGFRWRAVARGAALLLVCAYAAEARRVRVATFNVEHGIGEPGSEKYETQKAVLRRVNADIIGFQELKRGSSNHWVRLAGDLGYPHRAWGEKGPFAGDMEVGFFSRFPLGEPVSVDSPPAARELSRRPLRVRIEVPGAARPLVLWNMHHKAMFERRDDFRRAVEARRIAADVERHFAAHPELVDLVILGDMNDDPARPEQSERFDAPPGALPGTFVLGEDIAWPLRYREFPPDAYARVGPGFRPVPALRQDSDIAITHFYTNLRLDWIFASTALWQHPDGVPAGEIYHSEWDVAGGGGLPKTGEPPPPETSLKASDHYVVFVDLNLADAPEPAADPAGDRGQRAPARASHRGPAEADRR